MATATRSRNETPAQGDSPAAAEAQPDNKGLVARIKDKFRGREDAGPVELGDGVVVSAVAGRFLRDREGSQFIGTTVEVLARETDPTGRFRQWAPYRPDLHPPGTAKRLAIVEFLNAPMRPDDVTGRADASSKGVFFWMVADGQLRGPVGRRLSVTCLRRMQTNGFLSEYGEKMLAEQAPPAVELTEEALTV